MSGTGHSHRRTRVIALVAAALLAAAVSTGRADASATPTATLSDGLYDNAVANPQSMFRIVVQAAPEYSGGDVAGAVNDAIDTAPGDGGAIIDRFAVIPGLTASVSGEQLVALASDPAVGVISSDTKVVLTGSSAGGYSNDQQWPAVTGATKAWTSGARQPTIAIVDSGIQPGRDDFAGRVIDSVDLTTGTTPNSPGDGFGHGTFVASLAAGAAAGHAGFDPRAPIVSLDVMDDNGMARTSDVIAAADWIYRNRDTDNIRVANFSLTGSVESSFLYDPLDRAVEALWFHGIVVVAAAGNYATDGAASGVLYAPGNDPFVITVGANDTMTTVGTSDDAAAPWSSWGSTADGFEKPELCAPGRYMNGAVPSDSTMATQHPERLLSDPNYMWMSGTSFAAPIVSGSAAFLLGRHPTWSPDQVKGALMLAAKRGDDPNSLACGAGEVKAAASAALTSPPNPNAGLDQFIINDAQTGLPLFDGQDWIGTASSDASWDSAAWDSAAWDSASWDSAAWDSAAWDSAAWDSASWDSGTNADDSLPLTSDLTWVP